MDAEQLTEAVRKHAKTVLLPSVAQAIVEELGMQETQPVAKVSGNGFDHALMMVELPAGTPLYATPPDAAKRIAELEEALDSCVTEEGPDQDELNRARAILAGSAK